MTSLHNEPECTVTVDEHGQYHVRHNGTGDVETAATPKEAEMKAILLRVSAIYDRDIPFTTGDLGG